MIGVNLTAGRGADAAGRAPVVPVRKGGDRPAVTHRPSGVLERTPGRDTGYQGHVARQAEPVESFIERTVIARCQRLTWRT